MKLLVLNQTAELGGAELSLFSEVTNLSYDPTVCLFEDGALRMMLQAAGVNVEVLQAPSGPIAVRRQSGLLSIFFALPGVIWLVLAVARRAKAHDVIYANSQKAFVIGVLAATISGRPLVWRLRDVLSAAHLSTTLLRIVTALANWKAKSVIANSVASCKAFCIGGGNAKKISVVYPGIDDEPFTKISSDTVAAIRSEIGVGDASLIGVFGRLVTWKGQRVFIDAVSQLSDVVGVIVGGPLFGHQAFEAELKQKVAAMGLQDRILFLGFRNDIPALMTAMDIIVHSSIAPEPFGRVVVEGMLAGRPVVASAAGGILEIIEHGKTGWLCEPGNAAVLASTLQGILNDRVQAEMIAAAGRQRAQKKFTVKATVDQIEDALKRI